MAIEIIHHQFNEHFCSAKVGGAICRGKIVQQAEHKEGFPENQKICGPDAWKSGQMKVTTYCTRCGKRFPELDSSPL